MSHLGESSDLSVVGWRVRSAALAVVAIFTLAFAGIANAATFPAATTAQLETAVSSANSNAEPSNTIVLSGTFYAPKTTLTIKKQLTIEGPTTYPGAELGGSAVTPAGGSVLVVEKNDTLTLKRLGLATAGGPENPAINVKPLATLYLEAATLSGNGGTGILTASESNLYVANSTLSDGLGLAVVANAPSSESFFVNSTVAFNHGGGLAGSGEYSLTNTLVADNTAGGHKNCAFKAETQDDSIDTDGSCGVSHTYTQAELKLGEHLLPDGGPTLLHSLQTGSPAIGAGDDSKCLATDQEGETREAGRCDVGADEWNSTKPTVKVPGNVIAQATSAEGAKVTYSGVQASSTVATVEELGCSPKSGTLFADGSTTVVCTATDGHGNTGTASFSVSVLTNPSAITLSTLGSLPVGLATNSEGDLWVATAANGAIPGTIKEFTTEGVFIRQLPATLASPCKGSITESVGLAVDTSNNLWVTDRQGDRVLKFSPAGVCELEFGTKGSGSGQLSTPQGIAVSPKSGDIIVADAANDRMEDFSPSGTFIRTLPVGLGEWPWGVVVNVEGDVFVSDFLSSINSVLEYSETGEHLGTITAHGASERIFEFPAGMAIGPDGDLFVVNWFDNNVQAFGAGGEYLGLFGSCCTGTGGMALPIAVAVDPLGNVWVAEQTTGRVEKWVGADPPAPLDAVVPAGATAAFTPTSAAPAVHVTAAVPASSAAAPVPASGLRPTVAHRTGRRSRLPRGARSHREPGWLRAAIRRLHA
jgi:streptogramin lyase